MSIVKTELYVVTTTVKADDEIIATQKFLRTFPSTHEVEINLVKRDELHVRRPVMEEFGGIMVRWARIPSVDIDMVAFVYHELSKLGLSPVAQSPKMSIVAPVTKEERAKLITNVIPPAHLKAQMHEILRLPIYWKVAPVEEPFKEVLPEETFENKLFDGVIAFWNGPTCQVRVRGVAPDGSEVWQKGLLVHSTNGWAARCKWAEFGKELPREVEVFVISRYKEMAAQQNLLAVLAGLEYPAEYIDHENQRLAAANINQFLDRRIQEMVSIGAPIGALLRVPQLYGLVERFPVDRKMGGTFLVLPDHTGQVGKGQFALGRGSSYRPTMQGQTAWRNPVMFRGGITELQFWGYIDGGDEFAVYLNPRDKETLEFLAADFDGDLMVVKEREEHEHYRASLEHQTKYLLPPQKLSSNKLDAVLAGMVNSPFNKTGTVTLAGMRLRVMDQLTDELAVLTSDLTQGSTHAAKKHVDKNRHAKDLAALQEAVFCVVPEEGTVVDKTNAVRREIAPEAKAEAFEKVLQHQPSTVIEQAIVERAHIVARHTKAVEVLGKWAKAWPAQVKERADQDLVNALMQEQLTQEMINSARNLADQFRQLSAQEVTDEDEREARKRAFEVIRQNVELGVLFGWPQGLLVKYLPVSLAIDFIEKSWLESCGVRQRFSYLQVEEALADGQYSPEEILTADERYPNLAAGATSIEIVRIEGELCIAQAVLDASVDVALAEEEEFLCG